MTPIAYLTPLAVASGVNLYLAVLVVGICTRFDLIPDLPFGLEILGTWPVLVVAGIMFVVEFFADKVPYVDSVWDVFHTVIRPAGALLLALNVLPPDTDPALRTSMAVLASGAALTSHSSKAGARALVNTSPEPFSNVLVSFVEDVLVIGGVILALMFPVVATVVAVVLLVLLVFFLVWLVGFARRAFGGVRNFFRTAEQREHAARTGS